MGEDAADELAHEPGALLQSVSVCDDEASVGDGDESTRGPDCELVGEERSGEETGL